MFSIGQSNFNPTLFVVLCGFNFLKALNTTVMEFHEGNFRCV